MAVTCIIEAANALATGAVNYVLVFRALHHPAGERYNQSSAGVSCWQGAMGTHLRLGAPPTNARLFTTSGYLEG